MDYETRFGTGWEVLDRDEALIRAFALGVADEYGNAPPEELDRLRSVVDNRYWLHLIETAYLEGQGFGETYHETDGDVERALPEFLREAGLDVAQLLDSPSSDIDSSTVPSMLAETPFNPSVSAGGPVFGPPRFLYRFKGNRHP